MGKNGGAPFHGTLRECKLSGDGLKKVLRRLSLSVGAPMGTFLEGVPFTENLRDTRRRAPELEHLPLRELCEGNPERRCFPGDIENYVEVVSGDGNLSPFGKLSKRLTRGFVRWMKGL